MAATGKTLLVVWVIFNWCRAVYFSVGVQISFSCLTNVTFLVIFFLIFRSRVYFWDTLSGGSTVNMVRGFMWARAGGFGGFNHHYKPFMRYTPPWRFRETKNCIGLNE